MSQDVFAFAANIDANIQRIIDGTGNDRPRSDNDSTFAYASPSRFDLPPSDELLAASDKLICDRFWSHVDKHGPVHPRLGTRCWLWTANCTGQGNKNRPANSKHGQFTYRVNGSKQRHVYAHRFAWVMAHGPIPPGLNILHHCDCPPCVRDDHHFVGTQDDNMKDAARKNRFTVPRTCTLSLYDRLTIYRAPRFRGSDVALARAYGVSKACISLIRRGRFLGSGVWGGTKPGVEVETIVRLRA